MKADKLSKINFLTYLTNQKLATHTSYFLESRYNFIVHTETSPNTTIDYTPFNWILTNLKTLKDSPRLLELLQSTPHLKKIITYYNCNPKSVKLPFDVIATINEENIEHALDEKLGQFFQPDLGLGTQEFTAISIPILKNTSPLDEDIYIKLISDRFVKLFHRKEELVANDYEKYQKKGVSCFYIRRNSFIWSEKSNLTLTPEINASVDSKPSELQLPSATIQEIKKDHPPKESQLKDIKDYNLNGPIKLEQELITAIHENLEKAMTTIKNNKSLGAFIKSIDLTNKDYISLKIEYMCNITCALANALEWGNDATFEKLIYCSHVHDMKLFQHPEILRVQTLAELNEVPDLSPELMKIYKNHPEEIAKIIREDSKAPQDAELIVLQHHELPGDRGFPQRFQVNRILPFSAIINLSSDLTDDMIRYGRRWNLQNFMQSRADRYNEGIFERLLKEVERLLAESFQERVTL